MAKADSGSLSARLARWRWLVQTPFLLVWASPWLRIHSVCAPVFHCYACPWATFGCPVGVVANFSALHVFPFVAVGTLVVAGVLFGSFVCAWACPFGFLQDLIARVPTPKFTLPAWTGYTRYVILIALVVWIPFFYGLEKDPLWFLFGRGEGEEHNRLFFCSLCPAGALEAAVLPNVVEMAGGKEAKDLVWPNAVKTAILVLLLLAMFFVHRPWCRLFCPLGAVYGLCNYVSVFFLRFQPADCNDCDLCRRICRYRGRSERRAANQRCIRCLECSQCRAITVGSIFGRSGGSSKGS
jgi:ferredoxin-type protein NapH